MSNCQSQGKMYILKGAFFPLFALLCHYCAGKLVIVMIMSHMFLGVKHKEKNVL